MSEYVDLGQLRIEDRSTGLSCTVGGTASFARLDDAFHGPFETALAERLSSFDAWTSTGGSVRLTLETALRGYDGHQVLVADVRRDLARILSESTVKMFAVKGIRRR